MLFDELIRKLGYEKADLEVVKRLSHLLEKDDRSDFILSYMSNDIESLNKYAEKIEERIDSINCDITDLKGHEELLVYYICKKLQEEKGYGDIAKYKYKVAKDFLDSIPILIYLHDVFKGLRFGGGRSRNKLKEMLKDIFSEYDIVASIAEEAPELINSSSEDYKERYPVAIVSPIFCDVKEIYKPGDVDALNKSIKEKLDVESEPKELIDKEEWDKIAKSLLLTPQRTWFSGNDIKVIAHMRGALYAYLLSNGATLIKLENPFFNPTSLKDLRGSSGILRIFSYHPFEPEDIRKNECKYVFLT